MSSSRPDLRVFLSALLLCCSGAAPHTIICTMCPDGTFTVREADSRASDIADESCSADMPSVKDVRMVAPFVSLTD